ncbi:MAG: C-terminal helicase domain-containing protein [Tetrasphaera sp.]
MSARPDPKARRPLIGLLKPLIAKGTNPVVFCRFIATAEHVARRPPPRPSRNSDVEAVTGALTADDRRDRVADHGRRRRNASSSPPIACPRASTFKQLFDAVIHYDLSWNPTRHQQREGRVDRFGQPSPRVRSVLMFSPDSAIDGAVLEVILRKARRDPARRPASPCPCPTNAARSPTR